MVIRPSGRRGIFGLSSDTSSQQGEEDRPALPPRTMVHELPADVPAVPPAYGATPANTEISLASGPSTRDGKDGDNPHEVLTDPESGEDTDETVSVADDDEDWGLDEMITPADSVSNVGLPPSYEESQANRSVGGGEEFPENEKNMTVDDMVRDVMGTCRPIQTEADERPRAPSAGTSFSYQPPPYPPPQPTQQPTEHSKQQPINQTQYQAPPRPPHKPLSCPVVVPQRRPGPRGSKYRGFVRAYSPVLANAGVDQETFLRFLKNFHRSSLSSPVFPTVELAASMATMTPSVTAMAVLTAMQSGHATGVNPRSDSRTNDFLERCNDQFLKPAGLYAMIVKYKSDEAMLRTGSSILMRLQNVDVTNQTVTRHARTIHGDAHPGASRGISDDMQGLDIRGGGNIELPEAAPLIYPDIDAKIAKDGPDSFSSKAPDTPAFLTDYLERRAHMLKSLQSPTQNTAQSLLGTSEVLLTTKLLPLLDRHQRKKERSLRKDSRRMARGKEPKHEKRARKFGSGYAEELRSRTSDRHKGLLQGGLFDPQTGGLTGRGSIVGGILASRGSRCGDEKHTAAVAAVQPSRDEDRYSARRGFDNQSASSRHRQARRERRERRHGAGGVRGVRRIMREDVLYLMVVNMPSDEELAVALAEVESANPSGT